MKRKGFWLGLAAFALLPIIWKLNNDGLPRRRAQPQISRGAGAVKSLILPTFLRREPLSWTAWDELAFLVSAEPTKERVTVWIPFHRITLEKLDYDRKQATLLKEDEDVWSECSNVTDADITRGWEFIRKNRSCIIE